MISSNTPHKSASKMICPTFLSEEVMEQDLKPYRLTVLLLCYAAPPYLGSLWEGPGESHWWAQDFTDSASSSVAELTCLHTVHTFTLAMLLALFNISSLFLLSQRFSFTCWIGGNGLCYFLKDASCIQTVVSLAGNILYNIWNPWILFSPATYWLELFKINHLLEVWLPFQKTYLSPFLAPYSTSSFHIILTPSFFCKLIYTPWITLSDVLTIIPEIMIL